MNKRKAQPLPRKPEFAMTGVAVGAGAGLVAGLIAEIAWRPSMLVMQAGGVVGIAVGGVFEAVRDGWRSHRFLKMHREAKPTLRR